MVVQSENVIIFSEKSVYKSIECALDARIWRIKKETNSYEMRFKESYRWIGKRERKREKCFVTVIHRRNLFAQSDGLKPLVLDEMAKVGGMMK